MQTATILMDGHVHLYPEYDLQKAFRAGFENMNKYLNKAGLNRPENVFTVWLLTERWDCTYFKQMYQSPEKFSTPDMKIIPLAEGDAVMIEKAGAPIHFILAGRQLVSKDGLEVLSLASNLFVKDRSQTTRELIDSVNESGGIPVLNWAPGKWFFKRGKIVQNLIKESEPTSFVIGDSALRFTLWPQPKLMKDAVKRGFKLVAGSDPLPFHGEEKNVGIYGFLAKGQFDPKQPVTSVRRLLKDQETLVKLTGKRNGPLTFLYRETRIMAKK